MPVLRALILCLVPAALSAEPFLCPDDRFIVDNADVYADRICRVAAEAVDDLAACNLPLDRPITITLSRELEDNCVGTYHCSEDLIELSHPDVLAAIIDKSALFSALDVMTYFDSILYHELVHAAFDTVYCPFDACPATAEYLAYALQIRALSPEDRARIGLGEIPEERISREAINAIMVYWAPDRFALKAWTHLMQRPDPCAYVGLIGQGDIRFDFEHP